MRGEKLFSFSYIAPRCRKILQRFQHCPPLNKLVVQKVHGAFLFLNSLSAMDGRDCPLKN